MSNQIDVSSLGPESLTPEGVILPADIHAEVREYLKPEHYTPELANLVGAFTALYAHFKAHPGCDPAPIMSFMAEAQGAAIKQLRVRACEVEGGIYGTRQSAIHVAAYLALHGVQNGILPPGPEAGG